MPRFNEPSMMRCPYCSGARKSGPSWAAVIVTVVMTVAVAFVVKGAIPYI